MLGRPTRADGPSLMISRGQQGLKYGVPRDAPSCVPDGRVEVGDSVPAGERGGQKEEAELCDGKGSQQQSFTAPRRLAVKERLLLVLLAMANVFLDTDGVYRWTNGRAAAQGLRLLPQGSYIPPTNSSESVAERGASALARHFDELEMGPEAYAVGHDSRFWFRGVLARCAVRDDHTVSWRHELGRR